MPASPLMQKLIQIPVCRGLTEGEAGVIFEVSEETSVKNGELLFAEGDAGDALYSILEGHVEITKKDGAGRQQVLAQIGEGGVLGEMSLISGGMPRSASARATTDVRLLKIPSARFGRLLKSDNLAALKIVYNLAQVMSRRLVMMDEKLVGLMDRQEKRTELVDFQKLLSNWSF